MRGALHITPYQLLIVASIVEREALLARDRPRVAAVIYNRLRLGMPLGIDSTLRYALHDFSKPLTAEQLHCDSPYNTRTHHGLPPTPISNPGTRRDRGRGAPRARALPVLRRRRRRLRRAGLLDELRRSSKATPPPTSRRSRGTAGAFRPAREASSACVRLGVLGWPVAHSRSPAMQTAAFAAVGLHDWSYQRLPVPPELFAQTVRALGGAGFLGANVTIPHKEAALALADSASAAARAIGAANTLTFAADGTIEAENTDAPGLIAALDARPRAAQSALVLGAGGSARAAVWALLEAGAREVSVWNRTPAARGRAGACARRRAVVAPDPRRPARQLHRGRTAQRSARRVRGAQPTRHDPRSSR